MRKCLYAIQPDILEVAHGSLGSVSYSLVYSHWINSSYAALPVPNNCMITKPDQSHLVTTSSSSFDIDPIFPSVRELRLLKTSFAHMKKIVRYGSSICISSPKLKLVKQ